jgi:hypothetical protein
MTTRMIVGLRPGQIHFRFTAAKNSGPEFPAGRFDQPGSVGQHIYPAVRMNFWQGENSCPLKSLCLLRTLPADFLIA